MGLVRYTLNFEGMREFIDDAIANSSLNIKPEVTADGILIENIGMEQMVKDINATGQSKQAVVDAFNEMNVINNTLYTSIVETYLPMYDEDSKKIYHELIRDVVGGSLQGILDQLNDLYNYMESKSNYVSKVISFYGIIKPLQEPFIQEITLKNNWYFTGLSFNMMGWKWQDTISVKIGEEYIMQNARIKGHSESFILSKKYPVKKNEVLQIMFNNEAGNHHQLFLDVEYVEKVR